MILAHYTSSDSSSVALVLGLALLVLGVRGLLRDRGREHGRGHEHEHEHAGARRPLIQLVAGAVLLAGGIAIGWIH